jgi:hypothetical protein
MRAHERTARAAYRFGVALIALAVAIAGCAEITIDGARSDRGGPGPGPGAGGAPRATLTALGPVSVFRGGSSLHYRPGMALNARDLVETGGAGQATIHFANGDEVYLQPATRVEVGSIRLFFGELFARLVGGQGVFQVETEFLSAGSEGTEYLVRVDRASGATTVIVRQGVVVCRPTRAPSQAVRLAPAEQLVLARPAPPAPDRPPATVTPVVKTKLPPAEIARVTRWADDLQVRVRRITPQPTSPQPAPGRVEPPPRRVPAQPAPSPRPVEPERLRRDPIRSEPPPAPEQPQPLRRPVIPSQPSEPSQPPIR